MREMFVEMNKPKQKRKIKTIEWRNILPFREKGMKDVIFPGQCTVYYY